jgi:acyl-CoA synthetase (AMP-forming)/AMP-acid ligase II
MRIIDFFEQGVRYYGEKVAFVDATSTFTYTQADKEIHRIAGAIHGNGFEKGDRIGVYSPNANAAFLALLGLMRAEAVWLPINPRNSIESNVDLADRFGMSVMLYSEAFNEEVKEIQAAVPGIKAFVCIDGEGSIGQSLEAFCNGQPEAHEPGSEEPGELAAIFGTGGTTGKSKGVLMNHTALETFFQNYHAHFNYKEDSVHLVVAPMTHTAGIMGCLHFPRGGRNVICASPDPLTIMQDIEKHGVTHLFLPPTVLYMMLAHEDVRKFDYSSLQHFMVGAAPTSLEKLKEACEVFGACMTEAYGQTEAPAAITLKAPWDYIDSDGTIIEHRLRGIGRPAIFNQVKILDTDGNEAPHGEPGEICVAGNLVTQGYLDNPEATNEAFRDGWLWTGDIGVMAEDGYIEIVDRRKDMIISGGFNVYPNEVEQIITEMTAVQECAVIGIPDEKWGEAVKAVVQLKPGDGLGEDELINYVKDKLGSVKAPKSIDFVDELPKSPVGKVLKTELRDRYWSGMDKSVN